MKKLIGIIAALVLSACEGSVPVDLSYEEPADGGPAIVYIDRTVYIIETVDGGVLECPPVETDAGTPDAGTPDAGEDEKKGPRCDKGKKTGNKHCED